MHRRLQLAFLLALAPLLFAARKPKPPLAAAQYAMHQAHNGVTIAAEPGDTAATRPDTRLDYFAHSFLPLRVIVTNDTNDPVNLDDARIHFIAADDLQRRLFTIKSATGSRIPLGLPIPITLGKSNVDKKITDDDNDFGFKTTTVAPHTTVAGYLYYDTQDLPQPALAHAVLQLRQVRFANTNAVLDTFEIPLHPSNESTPNP
jgi:hypothetical protein